MTLKTTHRVNARNLWEILCRTLTEELIQTNIDYIKEYYFEYYLWKLKIQLYVPNEDLAQIPYLWATFIVQVSWPTADYQMSRLGAHAVRGEAGVRYTNDSEYSPVFALSTVIVHDSVP